MTTVQTYRTELWGALATLYKDCLDHCNLPPAPQKTKDQIIGFLDAGKYLSCDFAFDGAQRVGFVTQALTFPARSRTAIFMKELYVLATAQSKGVGRTLMDTLSQTAKRKGCTWIDWQTDRSKTTSQHFYSGLGVPSFDRVPYWIDEAQLAEFESD